MKQMSPCAALKTVVQFHGLVLLTVWCVACTPSVPREVLQLRPESMALRQLQTRRFDTSDEKNLLSAALGVLQDLGFTIDESEASLGVLVASKQRDAYDTGQIVGAIMVGALLGTEVSYDTEQRIRVSVVTAPVSKKSTKLRVTFQRVVWNSRHDITRSESLEDATLYQEFFDKLSKAVFLEAHEL